MNDPMIHDLAALPRIGPAVVCMGVFDGVHRGHAALVATTAAAAGERGIASVALLFDPPPAEVIEHGQHVPRLGPPAENLRRLSEAGADAPVGIRFTDAVRRLPPDEFLAALAPAVEVRAVVMTPDSAFGRARAGTPEAMRALDVEVVLLEEQVLHEREPISSSRIRGRVAAGDVATAAAMLGRPPFLVGTVVHGEARGRELGYPTANLAFDYVPAMPAKGIYAGHVAVPSVRVGPGHPAVVSVGVRPTFERSGSVLVEAHLLDFDGDLYDRRLKVELTVRLRDELRFDSVDALVSQMHEDERQARARLENGLYQRRRV